MVARNADRIAMVVYAHYPWDPRVRREAETLARLGCEVTVVCARGPDEGAEDVVANVRVRRVPLQIVRGGPLRYVYQYAVFLLLAFGTLGSVRRHRGVDVVHGHSLPDFIVFAGLGEKLRGKPVILDLHEASPELAAARFPDSAFVRWSTLVAEKVSCLLADHVIVANETVRGIMSRRGIDVAHVTAVLNSPDPMDLDGIPPTTTRDRTGTLRIVYAGGLNPERDLETLVRAVARLRKTRPTSLTVFGPGPAAYETRLRNLARELGMESAVSFGGVLPSSHVLAHLVQTDVGVATYVRNPHTEIALPSKGFESIMLDKPLVVANLRAMRMAFADAALFYEPGDDGDLAAKIEAAAAGGPQIEAMRQRARQLFERSKWENQVGKLVAAYAAVGVHLPNAGGIEPST